jgi:hypothetical protein
LLGLLLHSRSLPLTMLEPGLSNFPSQGHQGIGIILTVGGSPYSLHILNYFVALAVQLALGPFILLILASSPQCVVKVDASSV